MDKEKNSIERQKFQMTQKGFETIGKNLEKIANKKDVQKVEIQGASIVTIKGDKGDPGHTPTDTELLAIIKPLIPVLRQPEDGHTPTEDELLDLIRPLIPSVKDGETPSDERLLSLIKPLIPKIEKVNTDKIVEEVKKLSIEELKALIPESDTAEQIIKKLLSIKKAWLPAEAIDGDIVQHITRIVKQFGGSSGGISEARVREIISDMPSSFITLKDTFDSYTGLAGKGLRVNATETGIDTYIPTDTDEKVAYKSGSTPGYLKDVTVAGTGITLEEGTGSDAGKLKITNSLDLSGYVPYTGATADLNLGTHSITASNFTGSSSGSNTGDQDLSNLVEEAPSDDKQYARKNAGWVEVEAGSTGDGIGFDIDGFGIVPSTTVIGSYVAKKSGTITGWKIIESNGVSSSIVLTVKKNGTEISGTEKPTLSNVSSAEDTELTTWTTSIAKGDIISISIDSVSVGTKFFLQIYYS